MDLVPYTEGPEADNSSQEAIPPEPVTLEEAKREVAEALKEIWELPESGRSSAIKRLIRQWHPDKNKGPLATEVTQFLLNEVERLKKGGVPGYQPDTDNSNQSSRRPSRPAWNGPNFREYSRRHGERTRQEQERRSERQDDNENEPANTDEAERWMQQAQKDFGTASYLFRSEGETYYSFTCFHCQQAIEKALKAFMFANGRLKRSDLEVHEVLTLAYRASGMHPRLHVIPGMVRVIHERRYYIKTRYPQYRRGNFFHDPIPAEMFTQRDAEEALSNAREILQLLRQVMD